MLILFFFFKQKTAYEMRSSDWSSDVCSSDLKQEKPVKAPENTDEGKLAAEKPEPKKDAEEGGNSDPEPKEGEDKPEGKQDRRYPEAPSKFLPKAQEVWRNTPLAVQQEVDRIEIGRASCRERGQYV